MLIYTNDKGQLRGKTAAKPSQVDVLEGFLELAMGFNDRENHWVTWSYQDATASPAPPALAQGRGSSA